jgi:O-antigen ligase
MGIIAGVVMLGPFLGKMILDTPIYLYLGRPVGSFGNPNFLAGFVVTAIPFLWYLKKWWKRGLALTIIGSTLVLTRSRGAVAAVLTVAFGGVLFKLTGAKKFVIATAVILLVLGLAVLRFSVWKVPTKENNWPQSRQRIFGRAVLAFYKRPIIGYGLENYELAVKDINYPQPLTETGEVWVDKAHNEILEILVGSGLVGLVLWFGIVILTVRSFYRTQIYPPLLAFLILIVRMQGNVVSTMEYGLFWTIVGLGLIAGNQRRNLSEVGLK